MPPKLQLPKTTDEGHLDIHISRDKTQGENSMMAFVKQHMGEILRPFAEHVEQLHQAVEQLGEDLAATDQKVLLAHNRLDANDQIVKLVRGDLDNTTNLAQRTQSGLDKTNSEKALLEADHHETKMHLGRVHSRLLDAVAHIEKLQHGLDDTKTVLDQTKMGLENMRSHVANDVDPKISSQADDIAKLDAATRATAQLLAATKRFGEDSHEEFKAHVQAREVQNKKDKERFEASDNKSTHLSTMLTETINRLNTHANHLRTTNTAIRPLKEQFDQMAQSQHVMQLTEKDHAVQIANLQHEISGLGENYRRMSGKLRAADDGAGAATKQAGAATKTTTAPPQADVYDEIERLQNTLSKHSKNLEHLDETVSGGGNQAVLLERRVGLLEHGYVKHEQQLKNLETQVGIDPASIPQPTAPSVVPGGGPDHAALGNLLKFQTAVSSVSIKERLRQYKSKLDNHDQDLEKTDLRLQVTAKDLQQKGQRVEALENQVRTLQQGVEEVKAGLELTEEYWKGLSHGFRETHRSLNIDKELLGTPRTLASMRGKTLPAITSNSLETPGPTQSMGGRMF